MIASSAPHGMHNFDLSSKTVAEVLGEITWLMTQDQSWKSKSISDIEMFAIPAIALKCFRIFYVYNNEQKVILDKNQKNNIKPVGVVFWEFFNRELDENKKSLPRINTGLVTDTLPQTAKYSITFVIAPFGGEEEMRNTVATELKCS